MNEIFYNWKIFSFTGMRYKMRERNFLRESNFFQSSHYDIVNYLNGFLKELTESVDLTLKIGF